MRLSGHFSSALVANDGLAMYQAMLDHLPVGIGIFDHEFRLMAINRRLVDMLDFPLSMFEGVLPTLEDLTLFNAKRGDYGAGDPHQQTFERMELARQRQAHRFKRVRPNGHVLEITGAPLPNGGFISIYTDITEQQHVEAALREQALYLKSVMDHLPQGISVFDAQLHLKCWNTTFLDVLNLPPESAYPDVPFENLIMVPALRGEYGPGDPVEQVAQRRAMALKFQAHRFERTRPNGRTHLVEGRPMLMDGQTVGFVTSYTDITEQNATERELRRQSEVFQTLVDNIPGGVTLFGADLRLLVYNQEYARLLNFPPELFEDNPTLERFFRFNAERGEYGHGDAEVQVQQLLDRARLHLPHQFTRTRPDGSILDVRGLPLADGSFVTIYTDVTEQHRAVEAIERLAHRDALTGLANRYTLEARLDQLVADARRHDRRLAVMFLDMDNFKTINDTLGHGVGDQFLQAIATRLNATVRDNDIVARLGGDEFVVVLADLEDPQDATSVAAKIIDSLRQPISVDRHALRASVSIGICFYPEDGKDRGALMQSADIAMYHAKNAGKGVFHFFDAAMMTAATKRLALEHDLREAVSQQQFVLHYQPQLDASGQRATGVEALIRWQKPSGELVPPNDFIPLAEELGLINEMGDWALQTACQTLARWRQCGLADLTMAVNLSAIQLRNAALPQSISAALLASGLPGQALTLEITESVAMQDPQASIERLGLIRALGVRLAMDDFGTGYSSLAYLKRLPLDYLKLDRAFVQDLETDCNDAAICAATIGLAHNLGFTVIAEGVETQAQRLYLANLGCDAFQGYYFSRPLPEAAAFEWLTAQDRMLIESKALLTTSTDPRN
jgi:diguanylate cyclase (GGDEF)-like protein